MKEFLDMTIYERIAYRNTQCAVEHIVGEFEGGIADGFFEDMPTYEELEDVVYDATITGTYREGFSMESRPIKEVNLAGEEFIREVIEYIFFIRGFRYPVHHEVPA